MPRCGILSAQKDEGPFLLEFVAHHRALGFSDIFLITNPSDDGTNELASALAGAGAIAHQELNTPPQQKPQDHAYLSARNLFALDELDWLLVLDGDELLNIHTGDGSVHEFLSRFDSSFDLVSINMACFGNYPHTAWSTSMSSEKFRYRMASSDWRNGAAKTFIHCPSNFRKLRPHGPQGFKPNRLLKIAYHGGLTVKYADPSDGKLYESLRRPGTSGNIHSIAQINHYVIRTWDAFQLRARRGRGAFPIGSVNRRHTESYFGGYTTARELDETIQRYKLRFAAVLRELLSVPAIRRCNEEVYRIYGQKISSLDTV